MSDSFARFLLEKAKKFEQSKKYTSEDFLRREKEWRRRKFLKWRRELIKIRDERQEKVRPKLAEWWLKEQEEKRKKKFELKQSNTKEEVLKLAKRVGFAYYKGIINDSDFGTYTSVIVQAHTRAVNAKNSFNLDCIMKDLHDANSMLSKHFSNYTNSE